MPELGSYGSVRGAAGNSRPYRERRQRQDAPQAQLAGVRKAPRHEVAGSWAPAGQRVLWGLYERGHCQASFHFHAFLYGAPRVKLWI